MTAANATDPPDAAATAPERVVFDDSQVDAHEQLRRLGVVILGLALGLALARFSGAAWDSTFGLGLIAALPFLAIAPLRRRLSAAIERLRHPTPPARHATALLVGLAAVLFAAVQAMRSGRDLIPVTHDEHSYWLGAVQLARGRLWYPPHPMGDFFESFHTLVEPVYASIYSPGTALMYLPGVWIGVPPYATAIIIYGCLAAAIYLLASRVADGVAGVLGALGAMVVFDAQGFATRMMAQGPTALLGAGLLLAWMNWRDSPPRRRWRWALAMGACAGWLAITRPVDGLAFAAPVAIATIGGLVVEHRRRAAPLFSLRAPTANGGRTALARGIAATVLAGLAGALPFLGLQVAQNLGTTSHPLRTPYVQYVQDFQPGIRFASGGIRDVSAMRRPATTLPQKLAYYDGWLGPIAQEQTNSSRLRRFSQKRLPTLASFSLPSPGFLPFLTLGALLALGAYGRPPGEPKRTQTANLHSVRGPLLVLLGVIVSFVLLYELNPVFLRRYALTLGAVTLPLAGAGLVAAEACAGPRLRPLLRILLSGGIVAWFVVTACAYPERMRPAASELTFKYQVVPYLVGRDPALVLVRFNGSDPHVEPVYNSGVPWPDDAPIVWAHDLDGGRRAGEILEYYARRQPERRVFLMFRPQLELHPMGGVRDALASFRAGRWPGDAPPRSQDTRTSQINPHEPARAPEEPER